MRSILEELFYGNICPNTDCRNYDEETKLLMEYIASHHDNLNETLSAQQKELLEKFDDCYSELTDINEREIFVYAFRLGARIAIEVLLPKCNRGSIFLPPQPKSAYKSLKYALMILRLKSKLRMQRRA